MYFVDLLVPPEITNWCALSRSQSSRHKGLLVRLVSVRHLVFFKASVKHGHIQSNIHTIQYRILLWEKVLRAEERKVWSRDSAARRDRGLQVYNLVWRIRRITNAGRREKVNFPSQNLRGWIQSMTLNLLRTYHQPDTNHYLRPKRGFILLHRYHSIHSQEWAPGNLSHWSSLSDGCMNLFRNSKRIQILKKWMKAEQRLKE